VLTVIKKLSQRSTLVCSTRLSAIYRIEGLVEEEPYRPRCVYPWWAIGVECWIVPKKGQEIYDDKAEAGKSDLEGGEQISSREVDMIVPD
jgi:hypothetical protein